MDSQGAMIAYCAAAAMTSGSFPTHLLDTATGEQRIPSHFRYVPASKKRKLPRNAPCHCGSGRKFKKCCGR